MSKNIIVLSDGTANSSAKFNKTNVWRTYEMLDLSDPAKQVAFYDDGVGNSGFKPLALLGGAIGIGLSRNVRELYAFLCRNYEEGDRIYGFGFSRGSFTIRILAGVVAKFGLLRRSAYTGEKDLARKARWIYTAYRKQHSGIGNEPILARIFRPLVARFRPREVTECISNETNFDKTITIEFLGLWDTVDAYGLPIDEMTAGWDRFVWPLSMRNRDLSDKVVKAVHALSLDDERNSFHPLLWNEAGNPGFPNVVRQNATAKNIKKERLSQVWFTGMHSDVGGGYPEDFMSFIPLNFVLDQAPKLSFNPIKREEYRDAERVGSLIHDSRAGLQAYYRYLPRKLAKLLDTGHMALRFSARKMPMPFTANMVKIERLKIHHSVFDRIANTGSNYSPIVLPAKYAVVMPGGRIESLGNNTFETPAVAAVRTKAQERVWDMVWWRRVTYFGTLFFTITLVLLPWIKSLPLLAVEDGEKCINSIACFVAGIPKFFGAFLPSFAATWVKTFSANPGIFLVLSSIILVLMYLGIVLDVKIHDRMQKLWHPSQTIDPSYSRLHNFRESKAYQWVLRVMKKQVLPLAFGLAALLGIIFGGVSAGSRIAFSLLDARGIFCQPDAVTPAAIQDNSYSNVLQFVAKSSCWSSGLAVKKGANYRVILNIAANPQAWTDNSLTADLAGIREGRNPLFAIPAWPTKRYIWENYMKPVARIRNLKPGGAGQDEYVLNPTFETSRQRLDCLVSDFTAQSSGELFFFVNDAIIYGVPDGLIGTYENNHGIADIYVKRIARIGEPFSLPPKMENISACDEFISKP